MVKRISLFFTALTVLTMMITSNIPMLSEGFRFEGLPGNTDYLTSIQKAATEADIAPSELPLAFQAPFYEIED
jgi:hypothetical protein